MENQTALQPNYLRGRTKPPVQIVLTYDLDAKLSAFAQERGEPRSVVVREALRRFFESEGRQG